MSVYEKPDEHWRYQGAVVMIYAEGWAKLVRAIYNVIKDMTPQQIDDGCSIYPVVVDDPFSRSAKSDGRVIHKR
jgi:hypothetical protein